MSKPDSGTRTPEATDRLLVGTCAGIWLVWLILTAVTLVMLINLGRGHRAAEGSPWLLYTVIAISAIVFVGATLLLLRARRAAAAAPESLPATALAAGATSATPPPKPSPAPVIEAPTEKIRVFGTSVESRPGRHAQKEDAAPANDGAAGTAEERALDRLWLRGTASLLATMGLALTAVSAATSLLASRHDVGGWLALGAAGVITAAMPAVLLAFQRQITADPTATD